MLAVESCKIVFLRGHFIFTCSDTFAVGCIVQPCTLEFSHSAQRQRQTDRHRRHDHANN